MEFDDLKRAWEECDRKLDNSIHLDTRRLRSSILGNGNAAPSRLSRCELDYSASVVVVQQQLESLRVERRRARNRRARKWMLRLAPLACTLLVILGIKILFDVNVYSVVGVAGFAVALVFGLMAGAARIKRSSLVSDFDGEEIVGTLQATLLRVLRRHRVLRG
jgi:hypothetical protein